MNRQRLYVPGVEHKAPIPMGIKIGNMVFSSAISGKDPNTGKLPLDVKDEVKFVFNHIRTLVEDAGGTTDDIAKFAVSLTDNSLRELVNEEWIKMFPNENDRPVRHITLYEPSNNSTHIQIEFIAVLS